MGGKQRRRLPGGSDDTDAESREAGIGERHDVLEAQCTGGVVAEHRGDLQRGAPVLHHDLGAQRVHLELPGECRRALAFRLEVEDILPGIDDEHVVQETPLRRQQGRPDGMTGRDLPRVVRNQALQELDAVGAGHGDDAAMGQQAELGGHASELGLRTSLGKRLKSIEKIWLISVAAPQSRMPRCRSDCSTSSTSCSTDRSAVRSCRSGASGGS